MANYVPYQKKEYQQSDAVTQAQKTLQEHQQNKPGEYQSQWSEKLNGLLDKITNRKSFRYDANADALYQQYKNQYAQHGKQAMMDTIGQASALTGGYGNSYAQTAGQQTYQGYLQNINEMLPQYYEMALNRYNSEGDALLNQYGLLSDREDSDYSRYTDRVNRYYSDLDRYRNAYDNERSFDYGQYRDQVSDDESARQLAQQQVDYLISLGANVPDDLLAASGYNSGYLASINQLRAEQAAAAAAAQRAASSSGSGGGKEPVGGVKKIDPVLEQDDAMALYTTVIESGGTPQAGIQELVKAGASLTSAKGIANSYHRKHFG